MDCVGEVTCFIYLSVEMYKLKSSTFSSMFSFTGSKQTGNRAEGTDPIRPPTPRTRKSSSPDSPRRRNSTSFLNMSNPFENIRARSGSLSKSLSEVRIDELQPEPSENLLDRSVKIAFPKRGLSNGEGMTEIVLRERISEFGQVVNVSSPIFNESLYHTNCSEKFLGTISPSFTSIL